MDRAALETLISSALKESTLKRVVYSRPLDKAVKRADARPVMLKDGLFVQLAVYLADGKVRHKNVPVQDAPGELAHAFEEGYRQANVITTAGERQVMKNKDGSYKAIGSLKSLDTAAPQRHHAQEHDQKSNHILPEVPTPFLKLLDIMDDKGHVYPRSRAKFRQINRFLEFVRDLVADLGPQEELCVVDLCCGKGYLTFALYHYLARVLGLHVAVYGIDRKPDMMQRCQEVANQCGYDGLHFDCMEIEEFRPRQKVDLVVALHACDTATDVALAHAVKWNARAILAAPCCQHELPPQIKPDALHHMLKYPVARQRFAQLLTDTLRAQIIELCGYQVVLGEFIEWEDTPKNLLIRAVRRTKPLEPARRQALLADLYAQLSQFQVRHTLSVLLQERLK